MLMYSRINFKVDGDSSSTRQSAKKDFCVLVVEIPESLHKQIKSDCYARGVTMADEIRQLLIERFQ